MEKIHLKNLRTILLYKIIVITLILTISITYLRIKKTNIKKETANTYIGIISKIKIDENKTEIELENKNILIIIYEKKEYKLGDKIKDAFK